MSTKETRTELLQQLRELGVASVTAEYDGAGDDGQIETPEFGSVEVPRDLMMAVESLFFDLLWGQYSGWYDGGGAFGQFVWTIANDRIDLVHNIRQESYETEEQEL